MPRRRLIVGRPWEQTALFSLGVVASGPQLHTAGITARDREGKLVGRGDMRAQVAQCFANLGEILAAAGANFDDVVKYTVFTTDIEAYMLTQEMRVPFFVGKPAATLVEVRKLADPAMLVEVEAIVSVPTTSFPA